MQTIPGAKAGILRQAEMELYITDDGIEKDNSNKG